MKADKHKVEKTNAMRWLDAKHINYDVIIRDKSITENDLNFPNSSSPYESYDQVFKTLVNQANTGEYLVFMIPITMELDLKNVPKLPV